MVGRERIVAVSLLTERELAVVGEALNRVYRLDEDDSFANLLDAIDRAEHAMKLKAADKHN